MVPVPIAMFDRNLNYIAYSDAWLEMYNLKESILGKNHYEVFPQVPEEWKAIHKQVLETGIVQKNDCDYFILADNSELYLKWVVSPWYDEDGKIGGLSFLTQDITSEEVAKRRMNRSHEVAKLGWWEFDLTSQEINWSPEMFKIFPEDEKDGPPSLERHRSTIHPDDRENWEKTYGEAIKKQKPYSMIFRVLCPGKVKWVEAKGSPRKNLQGEVVAIYGTAQDVSEREEKRILLERKNEEMKIFSYRASHDLKAPLTSVEGLLEFTKEEIEAGNKEKALEDLSDMGELITELKQTISDVITVSMVDDYKSTPKPIKLSKVRDDLLLKLNPSFKQKNLQFECSLLPDEDTEIVIPRSKLKHILENLLSNSIKYSHSDRESFAKLCLEVKKQNLHITLSDNGIGFPENYQHKIFQMFTRFHTDYEGSGLGLYMIKRQIDDWHGRIDLDSSPQGTTFNILIPLTF